MNTPLSLCDGKYEFFDDSGILKCLRYGEDWRAFVGDKAVHALFDHVESLEDEITAYGDALIDFFEQADKCNFTDDHGHKLTQNVTFTALRDRVLATLTRRGAWPPKDEGTIVAAEEKREQRRARNLRLVQISAGVLDSKEEQQ